jgi:hypothetical protein
MSAPASSIANINSSVFSFEGSPAVKKAMKAFSSVKASVILLI